MQRHDFLHRLHEAYRPRTYLEIGVRDGRSLALSRARSVAVDPAFDITREVQCDVRLVRAPSDDFFATPDAMEHFGGVPVDLSFIDGMHLSEFALRDFVNAERVSATTSVAVFDDMLPRSVAEAARDRHTVLWTGDVYKVLLALTRDRPDLVVLPVDTTPTGVVVVLNLDPANTTLADTLSDLITEFVVPDPQDVPDAVLHRRDAVDPERLLALPVWEELRRARDTDGAAQVDFDGARALLGSASFTLVPPVEKPWPPAAPAKAPAGSAANGAAKPVKRAAATKPAPGSAADLARAGKGFARAAARYGKATIRRTRENAAQRRT